MQQQYVGLGYLFACFNAGCYGCSRGDIVPWRDVLYHLSKSLSVTILHIRWVMPSAFVESHTSRGVVILQNSTTYCALGVGIVNNLAIRLVSRYRGHDTIHIAIRGLQYNTYPVF